MTCLLCGRPAIGVSFSGRGVGRCYGGAECTRLAIARIDKLERDCDQLRRKCEGLEKQRLPQPPQEEL